MPLIKSKSKQAFKENIEAEMSASKPKNQSLAIAYGVKKKASHKKKMAEGGAISASNEKRPMPDDRHDDSKMVSQNMGKKPLVESGWTDRPDMKQSQKGPKTQPLKHPKMVGSSAYQAKLRTDEDYLMDIAAPASPKEQPSKAFDEEDADKSGPSIPDKSRPHSANLNKYAKGGVVSGSPDENSAASAKSSGWVSDEYGSGPEEDEVEHPAGLESDNDQMSPPEDEFMADHFAEGGEVDSMDQPDEEAEIEHAASIAAAIMAKRKMMAEGGQVDIESNEEEQPNGFYRQNQEALKEHYGDDLDDMGQPEDSNLTGDFREDERSDRHDMIGKIMKKMKKSPISR